MFPSDSLIQTSLINMRFDATSEEDSLAPFSTYIAPPSLARWRRSDTDTVQNRHLYGVAGRYTPMAPSHYQIRPYLTTHNVPDIPDDDFLAPSHQ